MYVMYMYLCISHGFASVESQFDQGKTLCESFKKPWFQLGFSWLIYTSVSKGSGGVLIGYYPLCFPIQLQGKLTCHAHIECDKILWSNS